VNQGKTQANHKRREALYVSNRVDHRQYCQAEGEPNAKQADAHVGKCSGQHGTAAPTKDQPECPEELCTILVQAPPLSSIVDGNS
jgi:hypothetical protein